MRKRLSNPIAIVAELMEADASMMREPRMDDGADVTDGLSGRPNTNVGECAARGCANNAGGKCSLNVVAINDHGGCTDYEADESGECDDDRDQEDVIVGISQLIPTDVTHPTTPETMAGRFNPGSML